MDDRILLVDDEPAVLDGYKRLLGRNFNLETALGPENGLARIATGESFAAVVSDMRMPGMNGVEFLARVMDRNPDVVRLMLTGNADIGTALEAVNEGHIFCFLTKPCPKEKFTKALTAALKQYRLIRAERDLLENTLRGSVEVLVEVLSLVNPAAFSRATRVRRFIQQVVKNLELKDAWQFEVAGLMSQLGCVTLHPETIEAVYAGQPLAPDQQSRVDAHPELARDLLSKIPRLEEIGWMIAQQNKSGALEQPEMSAGKPSESIILGAEILRATLVFDAALSKGQSKEQAIENVRSRFRTIDLQVIRALREVDLDQGRSQIRNCPISALAEGMILQQEVRSNIGLLIVARGQEVTMPLLLKLQNFHQAGSIPGEVLVALSANVDQGVGASVGAK